MSKKQLSVGVPATLNLKAELERARQECKEDSSAAKRRKASSLALGIGGRNRGVSDRAQRDKQALDDERLSHSFANARARQILEEKAKLYDLLSTAGDSASSLSASQLDDPRIAQILEEGSVDFVTKQLAFLRRRNAPQEGSSATGSAANSPGLIEVVDEFGRSRMVPQSEAHEYRQRSRTTAGSNSDDDSGDTSSSSSSGNESIDRRNRGLGYYNLSRGSDKRQDQLQALQLMHKHTLQTRGEAAIGVAEKQKQQLAHRQAQLTSCYERFKSSTSITDPIKPT